MWVRGHSRSLKLVPFKSLGAVSYSPSIVTMAVSVAVCEIFSVKQWYDLENQVRGGSRSLKMAPFNRPCDFLLVGHYKFSSILYHFRVFWRWIISIRIGVRGHSRSFKLAPFKSLGTVSYSPSIITMAVSVAVCEIFSVKGWCDLENKVRVRSRSLEMAPFDRPHTSSNSPSICAI